MMLPDQLIAPEPIWSPDNERMANAQLGQFRIAVNQRWSAECNDYLQLWRWSIKHPEAFWTTVWDNCQLIGDREGTVLEHGDRMPGARWFPQARVNYAENLLRFRDDADALVFWGEDRVKRRLSRKDLYDEVSRFAQALQAQGVVAGDRVAAYLPNMPETLIAMLATTALGAVWSSASPDFGVQGVLDRFGQIEPKVMLCVDAY